MKIRRLLHREIAHGGTVPRGWRMAWYEPKRRVGVYGPMPLHWALRLAREFGYRVSRALGAPAIERAEELELQSRLHERRRLAEEYSQGYLNGWRECFDTCMSAVEEELGRAEDLWEIGASIRDFSAGEAN